MVAFVGTSMAQTSGRPSPIKFGFKGGINSQSMTLTPTKGALSDYTLAPNEKIGYHLGIYARINFFIIDIQPELLYTVNSFKLKSTSLRNNGESVYSTVRVKNIELPVLASFKFLFLRLNAGPVFNLMNQTKVAETTDKIEASTLKPSVGYALGVGFSLRDIDFDLRYRGEFAKTKHSFKVADSPSADYRGKFNGWNVSIGYLF